MIIVLYALTALAYGGLAAAGWRSQRGQRLSAPVVGARSGAITEPGFKLGLLLTLVLHGVLLHASIFPPDSMVFGFAYALSAMFWLGAGIFLIESCFFPLGGLGLVLLPLAALASLLPAIFGGVRVLAYAADPLFKIHFLIANIAYGLLAIAALHAALMLLVERRLHGGHQSAGHARKRGPVGAWLDLLPPLLTMERLLFRLISAGFVVLTLALISGVIFSEQLLNRPLSFDHKTIFAILSWLMFAGLLAGRWRYGWRGRAALRWVLFSFLALLLAYVGSRFVLEVVLHRPVV